MDFNESIALYECLSKQLTSESEMSNDEYHLPKANEVVEAEVVNSNQNVNMRHGVFDNNKIVTRQLRKLDEHVKIQKPTFVKESISVIRRETCSEWNDKVEDDDAPAEEEKEYDPAGGDSSSDTDSDLFHTKKKRTASGSVTTVYVCSIEGCGKEFSRPWRLSAHQYTHSGKRPFECPVEGCGRAYTRKQHLQRHTATSHKEIKPQEYLKCEECNKVMKNKYILAKHYQRAHVRHSYNCKVCEQTFLKQQHLKSHSFTHTGVKPYMCEYPGCGERYLLPSRLRRHALIHVEKCYRCPNESCGLTFDSHLELRRHLATSHPKVCDVCGKKFRRLGKLKAHRKLHDDVREAFFCPAAKCDRYYYAEKNLAKHIRDKHEGTTIYQCSVCSLRLATKQKLADHMALHSPSYKQNNHSLKSLKPRKPRKDKGVSRTDYARLLSGYTGEESQPNANLGGDKSGSDDVSVSVNSKRACKEDNEDSETEMNLVATLRCVRTTGISMMEMKNQGSDLAALRHDRFTTLNVSDKHNRDSEMGDSLVTAEKQTRIFNDDNTFNFAVPIEHPPKINSDDDMDRLVLSSDDVVDSDYS